MFLAILLMLNNAFLNLNSNKILLTQNDSTYGPTESEARMYPPLSVNLPKRKSQGFVKNSVKPVEIGKNDTYENIPERDDDLWSILTDPYDRELLQKLMD